jgi:hypothetical protein
MLFGTYESEPSAEARQLQNCKLRCDRTGPAETNTSPAVATFKKRLTRGAGNPKLDTGSLHAEVPFAGEQFRSLIMFKKRTLFVVTLTCSMIVAPLVVSTEAQGAVVRRSTGAGTMRGLGGVGGMGGMGGMSRMPPRRSIKSSGQGTPKGGKGAPSNRGGRKSGR